MYAKYMFDSQDVTYNGPENLFKQKSQFDKIQTNT